MKMGWMRAVTAATLSTMLFSSTGVAGPTPVQVSPLTSQIEQVREDRTSRTATTKRWLRTKKNQTANWMGRQKRKLKNLVD